MVWQQHVSWLGPEWAYSGPRSINYRRRIERGAKDPSEPGFIPVRNRVSPIQTQPRRRVTRWKNVYYKAPAQRKLKYYSLAEAKRRREAAHRRTIWPYVKVEHPRQSREWQRGYVQAYLDDKHDDVFSKL